MLKTSMSDYEKSSMETYPFYFINRQSIHSDFIWPFLTPYMGVIPNPKMVFIFPISCILVLIFPFFMVYFPKCAGKGSFTKSQIKSLIHKTIFMQRIKKILMRKVFPAIALDKKDRQKSDPNEFRLGALSVGPYVVDESPFRALLQWWRVYLKRWTETLP